MLKKMMIGLIIISSIITTGCSNSSSSGGGSSTPTPTPPHKDNIAIDRDTATQGSIHIHEIENAPYSSISTSSIEIENFLMGSSSRPGTSGHIVIYESGQIAYRYRTDHGQQEISLNVKIKDIGEIADGRDGTDWSYKAYEITNSNGATMYYADNGHYLQRINEDVGYGLNPDSEDTDNNTVGDNQGLEPIPSGDIRAMQKSIDKMDSKINSVGAMSSAMVHSVASMPLTEVGDIGVGAGIGHMNDSQAISVSMGMLVTENVKVSGSVAIDTEGNDNMVGAGIGWKLKNKSNKN